jgi:hypothetical protein
MKVPKIAPESFGSGSGGKTLFIILSPVSETARTKNKPGTIIKDSPGSRLQAPCYLPGEILIGSPGIT